MHTWTVTGGTTRTGIADTIAAAWNAAYASATDSVRAGHLDRMTVTVDDQPATITPARSGDTERDIAATVEAIEATRLDVVAAHDDAQP